MARPKKDGTHVTIFMATPLFERLQAYAEEKGQTKTMAIERLLTKALDLEDN